MTVISLSSDVPDWARSRVRHPERLRELPGRSRGLRQDATNRNFVVRLESYVPESPPSCQTLSEGRPPGACRPDLTALPRHERAPILGFGNEIEGSEAEQLAEHFNVCPTCRAAILNCARSDISPCEGARQILAEWVTHIAPRAVPKGRPLSRRFSYRELLCIAVAEGYRILLAHHKFEPVTTLSDSRDANAYLTASMRNAVRDEDDEALSQEKRQHDNPALLDLLPGDTRDAVESLDTLRWIIRKKNEWLQSQSRRECAVFELWWQQFTGGPKMTDAQIAVEFGIHQTSVGRVRAKFRQFLRDQVKR